MSGKILGGLGRKIGREDQQLRRLLRGGFVSFVVKVGGVGLSFIMFLVLARAMSAEDFGRFGFAFSLATFLSVAGSFGQRTLALRFVPIYRSDSEGALLVGLLRNGYSLVVLGCAGLGAVAALAAVAYTGPIGQGYLFAAIAFTTVLGLAEYQAHVLRGFGAVGHALAPRDIYWRLAVITLAALPALGFIPPFSAGAILVLITVFLFAITLLQNLTYPVIRLTALLGAPAQYDFAKWRTTAIGLWGTSTVYAGAQNLSVVLVGAIMSPEQSGPFFAAVRVSLLMSFFLMASNMVAAPMIAQTFHAGDQRRLQHLANIVTIGVSLPTLACFLIVALFGQETLNLFGPGFEAAYVPLVILSAGQMINAIAGATGLYMEMTGGERAYGRYILGANVISLTVMFPMTIAFGMTGAAIATALATVIWNVAVSWWILKHRRLKIGLLSFGLTRFVE